MAAAKARGQHLGRERKLTDEDVAWARRMIEAGTLSDEETASFFRVSRLTLHRALRRGRLVEECTSEAP